MNPFLCVWRDLFASAAGPFGRGLFGAAALDQALLQQQDASGLLEAGQAAGAHCCRLHLEQILVLVAHVLQKHTPVILHIILFTGYFCECVTFFFLYAMNNTCTPTTYS
jgi:hypothetical protein